MLDLGWTEMMVVAVVALIVVGPKDLPGLFRKVGQFIGKAKGMARDFSRAMNDAADETGIKDVAKGLKAATNPMGSAMDGIKEATSDLTSSLDPTKFGPETETGKLSAERADAARKIQASTARMAATRKAKEAEEALAKADEAEAAVAQAEAEPAPAKDAESKS